MPDTMSKKEQDQSAAENVPDSKTESVIGYIQAIEKASMRWFDEVSKFEKMDSAYYWPLLTQIYRNDAKGRRTSLSDAEKFVPHLSASQVRRAITIAEEAGFVSLSDPHKRPRYVKLQPKAASLIEDTAEFALTEMSRFLSPD
ncbi:hypothetical protein [Denitrobaculum tricleocarpae]|uniref:MarR family transcriptional regulator n=1 Tax=Denitrobaculum tricleocarpae TaxID=2591009 RepID=A0A545TKR5_9PROT|nr:hypothetical protein [Denitrobaculum tricleocarpae]TQV77797.1 hypothetical protein FKG95_19765 [Denitrobaculum tricleocarpae]